MYLKIIFSTRRCKP